MNRETEKLVKGLNPESLSVMEVSGEGWAERFDFKSYLSTDYPDFDICGDPLLQQFDLIIAEQVFEHLLWPYRAGRNVYAMLEQGGYFLVSTPFMIKIHNHPVDCSRWSEVGMRHFLAECGFPLEKIQTWSWGNRDCVVGNLSRWATFKRRKHSLENDPTFPVMVWALAQK